MESSTSKAEIMKPLLFKAGIPLTLSLAAFVYSKILARRSVPKDYISETRVDSLETESHLSSDHESYNSLSNTCFPSVECNEPLIMDTNLEANILGLKGRIEELQKREWELETRFIRYIDLKEQESMLTRLRNAMLMEMAHVEFLEKEISLIEDENRRVENLVMEYLRALEQLQCWKSETGLLQRKVKKLSRRIKVQSSLMRERDLKIRAKEAELLRTREMLETTDVVTKLETEEVSELRSVLDCLRDEKKELSDKLDLEQKSTSSFSKNEAEMLTNEEQTRLENELEQLKKERAAEIKELIHLRWSNACLRHELMKIQEHREQQDQKRDNLELDFQCNVEIGNYELEQEFDSLVLKNDANENVFGVESGDQACSKRKKLLKRLRKWVEGCEKGKGKVGDERERHEVKCFGRHSVSYEPNEHLQGRWSCSSA